MSTLDVVPLGGLGEFGMNLMAVSTDHTTLIIDAGVMFAGPELPGVDLLIPDLSYLQQAGRRPSALVLTHGHEDHIGAVPYVWPLIDGPVYGTPLTLALVRPKLEEHGIDPGDRLVPVTPRDRVRVGDCEVEFLRVTHSMPDCVALAVHTPAGTIVHTGDFKIDQTPMDGQHFDVHRFAELGAGRRAGAVRRQHQHRPQGRHRLGARRDRGIRGDLHERAGEAGRHGVRLQRVPDADPRGSGRPLRPEGGVRRARHGGDLRDRPAARLPLASRRTRDSRYRSRRACPFRGALPHDRIAGRTVLGALPHRHRRSPAREGGARRHGGVLGSRDSGQREGDRADPQPPRPARSRGDLRRASSTCTCPGTAARKN